MNLFSPRFRSLRLSVLCGALMLLAPGCSTTGSTVIKIDAGKLKAVQSLRQEITRMLDDLGYDWIPVQDPKFALPVKAARHAGQWRMQFQARDRADIRIEARIDISGYAAFLRFHVVGAGGLDSSSESYYRKLRERLVLEFGSDRISGKDYFLAP